MCLLSYLEKMNVITCNTLLNQAPEIGAIIAYHPLVFIIDTGRFGKNENHNNLDVKLNLRTLLAKSSQSGSSGNKL